MARCQGTKPDGTPCERIVPGSQQFCYAHDPSRSEERSRHASKAGRVKPRTDLAEIKRTLKDIAEDVRAGRLETGKGSVCAQVYGVLIRAAEVERRLRETEEFEERLQALERARGLAR